MSTGFCNFFRFLQKRRETVCGFSAHRLLWLFFPRSGNKQQQHREDFQTPDEHIKHTDDLGKRRESREIPRRSDSAETGADVVDRCNRGSEIGREIKTVQ